MDRVPQLLGQTVLVVGGSSGVGLETARQARLEGAEVILTARGADRLHMAGLELKASIAAFDATDFHRLDRFFAELPGQIDHLLLSTGRPFAAPFGELDLEKARSDLERQLWLPLRIAQLSMSAIRRGGSLVLIGGTNGRRPAAGPMLSIMAAALPALTRSLALELAPRRVNLLAHGPMDTPLATATPGDQVGRRREQLRTTLPLGRVITPAEIAAVALQFMVNSAITGATFDVDAGQQLT